MPAVRVLNPQVVLSTQELVDGSGGRDAPVHAFPVEVAVSQRRADEDRTGSQGAQKLLEIERDLLQLPSIIGQNRHVEDLAPAPTEVPVVSTSPFVIQIGIKPATAGQHLNSLVKDGRIDGVVPTQGMPDGTESPRGNHV